ncbi:MAG: YdjY domain-containing protein, partial [Thermoanaerobaculia bacterium]|nr:YdjY domain-containing protein [Thermoanaerobaculia bacterium]
MREGRRRSPPAVIAGVLLAAGCAAPEPGEVVVDAEAGSVEFGARVNAAGFAEGETAGYHLIVYRGGGAAEGALLRADVTDVAVLDALEELGAVPGDALGLDVWEERHDPQSWQPERVIAGPPVEISVQAEAGGPFLGLDRILDDVAGVGFEMRFGGHRANIPAWSSGCVACLYSCPGSKVGNARCTVRDFVEGLAPFRVRTGVLPDDGE